MIKILELFGGIGSPRVALRNLGVPTKAIDYVEIDEKAVKSYNAMFAHELSYKTQSVVGYDLKPDILIHGSPCQDFSIAGHQKGADKGSETRSSLMWETVRIIEEMGEWKPKYVIWENVKNVLSKHMRVNFDNYLAYMEKLGYTNSFKVLDARDFGVPQARERVFTISVLDGEEFDFGRLELKDMQPLSNFLDDDYMDCHIVTQPSILNGVGKTGTVKRTTVLDDFAYTVTTRQDRTPAQVVQLEDGRYRFLTEKECWRLQGYSDADFFRAVTANIAPYGKMNRVLYHQAGNSIPVPIFESLFKVILEDLEESNLIQEQLQLSLV
jgi:DNA (cytosine-5-)-methyltransferase